MGREGDSNADNNYNIMQLNTFGFTRSSSYYYNDGNLYDQSFSGGFWSPTPHGKSNAYRLGFHSTYLGPRNNTARGYGFALRCLAR